MAKHPPIAERDLPDWPLGDPAAPLAEGELRVWMWSLEAPADERCLSPDELERADRYFFAPDRRHFVAARSGLRRVLAAMLSRQPADVQFAYLGMGKPRLAGESDGLFFNLSHSAGVGLLAVTHQCELGVDVEAIRPVQLATGIAERYFAAGEVAELTRLPREEQDAGFFRIWTNKEAVVKLLRSGLGFPLESFTTPLNADEGCGVELTQDNCLGLGRCHLQALPAGPRLRAAVATSAAPRQVSCFRLPSGSCHL